MVLSTREMGYMRGTCPVGARDVRFGVLEREARRGLIDDRIDLESGLFSVQRSEVFSCHHPEALRMEKYHITYVTAAAAREWLGERVLEFWSGKF